MDYQYETRNKTTVALAKGVTEPGQTSKMELLAKIINDFSF